MVPYAGSAWQASRPHSTTLLLNLRLIPEDDIPLNATPSSSYNTFKWSIRLGLCDHRLLQQPLRQSSVTSRSRSRLHLMCIFAPLRAPSYERFAKRDNSYSLDVALQNIVRDLECVTFRDHKCSIIPQSEIKKWCFIADLLHVD